MEDQGSLRDMIGQTDSVSATGRRTTVAPTKPDRIPKTIVIATTHHRDSDGKVKSLVTRSIRALENTDDPIIRKLKVGEEWIQLDTAWIKQVGHLHIMNEGGKKYQVVPTEEQKEEMKNQIVEVGYLLQPMLIPEGKYKPIRNSNRRTQFDIECEEQRGPQPLVLRLIHPGDCDISTPVDDIPIYLRCRCGEVTVSVMISPL